MDKINFTPDQRVAFDAVCSGKNVCITGPAGTGKSTLLKATCEMFKGGIDVTASTGIAALNVSGITIHSWSGLGLGEDPTNYIVGQILTRWKTKTRIRQCRRLAIDEISMLSGPVLTKLSEVLSLVRDDPRPFGGIQMIFIGDFLQLPPVSCGAFVGFAFSSPEWVRAEVEVHELTTIVRQKDPEFAALLNKIRVGTVDHEVASFLEARLAAVDTDPSTRAVFLEGKNEAADWHNKKALDSIPSEACRAVAKDWGEGAFLDRLKRDCIAPEVLDLKVGAQVMCLKNLLPDMGVVNGSVGVLLSFDGVDQDGNEGLPLVQFKGYKHAVAPATWQLKDGLSVVAQREQFPLRLAWAITIHKSQGMTLDKIQINLEDIFEAGQPYTGLSRARTPEGVFITAVDAGKIRAHPDAVAFYKNNKKSLPSAA